MRNNKVLIAVLSIFMMFMSGCDFLESLVDNKPSASSTTSAVVIGVENGYAGSCPGSLKDTDSMKELLSKYTKDITVLKDKQATSKNVVDAISKVVKNDFAIIYYSGHGGSAYTGNPEEADKTDEFLCCYDTSLIDDKIWELICKSKGRVFLIFDCCHSETMYRSPGMTFGKAVYRMSASSRSTTPNMLCWSGCPDDSYSYGSAYGGYFTLALIDACSSAKTYDEVWNKVSNDKNLKSAQKVKMTKIGNFDTLKKIFR